ncbi:MAG: M23 family metallopeptidase [Alphaproteobacteria bacterium]
MRLALSYSFMAVAVMLLSGCNLLLGSVSSSSGAITNLGSGSLTAYREAHVSGVRNSSITNPDARPARIPPHQDYAFRNAIPFYPRNAGTYVTSGYGWRNLRGRADFHCGVDVVAAVGTKVKAVVGGRVTLTRSAGSRGGVVIYASGRQYTYWHVVPSRSLRAGQWVSAGQTIGRLADWGSTTHLHYGIYLTGNNSDPNARKINNCVDPMSLAERGLL